MSYTFRPMETALPCPKGGHQSARFSTSYSATMELLERELKHLRAKSVVIQLHCDESQIRRDGLPRSDCRPLSPAVKVSFQSKHGLLTYPCNTFNNWKDNLRAIALALESLRRVDQYGVTSTGEQYRGWKALDHSTNHIREFRDVHEAAAFLAEHSDIKALAIVTSMGDARKAYKAVARKFHPDATDGDADQFKAANKAWEMIQSQEVMAP